MCVGVGVGGRGGERGKPGVKGAGVRGGGRGPGMDMQTYIKRTPIICQYLQ